MASESSWETFYRSFQQYAQSREGYLRSHGFDLDEVIEEAGERIAKMKNKGKAPPKYHKTMLKFACKTITQRKERERNRSRCLSEASRRRKKTRAHTKNHEHPDPGLVTRTFLHYGFNEEQAAIIKETCLSDDQSECPEGLSRPSSRNHAKKDVGSHEKFNRLVRKFKNALTSRRIVEEFLSLEKFEPFSESNEQWSEFLGQGFFRGKIAMILDEAEGEKIDIGYAITKHLPNMCKIYVNILKNIRLLKNPEEFNVLLSVGELLFLGCRYASRESREHILNMCEVGKKHQRSTPFFFDRCLRLLPAYCAHQEEEDQWKDLWCFYQMDENDKRFSLDALHLHAYNEPNNKLWHESKPILLERSSNFPKDIYTFMESDIDYTYHALKRAASSYKRNPSLQRMSLYWAWECFCFLPLEDKHRAKLHTAVEDLSCYEENNKLRNMLLDRYR
jgi:hypothetical protein